mmetsp:Transcript_14734/g.20479  ORF Transcript_14734/g.20479 Transcript_14734/m.20479 type:complete len:251 (+) Transcript_14734:80-832(+)
MRYMCVRMVRVPFIWRPGGRGEEAPRSVARESSVDVCPRGWPLPPPPGLPVGRAKRLHLELPVGGIVPALLVAAEIAPHPVDVPREGRPPGSDELVRVRAHDLLDHPVPVLVDPLQQPLVQEVGEEAHVVPLPHRIKHRVVSLVSGYVNQRAFVDHIVCDAHDLGHREPRVFVLEVVAPDVEGVEPPAPALLQQGGDHFVRLAEDLGLVVEAVSHEPLRPLVHSPVPEKDERVEVREQARVLPQVDREVH